MAIDDSFDIGEHVTVPAGFKPRNGIPPRTEIMMSPAYVGMTRAHNTSRTVRRGAYVVAGIAALAAVYVLVSSAMNPVQKNHSENTAAPKASQYQPPTR